MFCCVNIELHLCFRVASVVLAPAAEGDRTMAAMIKVMTLFTDS